MDSSSQTEAELERFREQWRAEVQARVETNHSSEPSAQRSSGKAPVRGHAQQASVSNLTPSQPYVDDDGELRAYHDLEARETGRRLHDTSVGGTGPSSQTEPTTALEFYEKAVEKEGQGNLGESLSHYRKAFKLDPTVQDKYKTKYFPAAKPPTVHSSKPSINGPVADNNAAAELPKSVSDLINGFENLSILGEPPPTKLSPAPPCPISRIPDEILVDILQVLARFNTASLSKLSQTCKRLAYLVSTEDSLWKALVHDTGFGLSAMVYDYTCTDEWEEMPQKVYGLEVATPLHIQASPKQILPLSSLFPSYRKMFRSRPRIRFNGCYISTVNYTRPGGVASNTLTWNHNILIVTYYRYLRFFPDGTLISLLTTVEPTDVVPYLQKENMHSRQERHERTTNFPQAVMRDALRGRWKLSGDPFGLKAERDATLGHETEPEDEGDIHIEMEGAAPKYKYVMHLRLRSAGRGARNNKLNWVGYWSYNRITDDIAAFGLKNDRPFVWSRVKSWL